MKEADLKSEVPPFDMAALERLLQDTAPVTVQSKYASRFLTSISVHFNVKSQILKTSYSFSCAQIMLDFDVKPQMLRSCCRPLSFLKATLNGLRGEISNLQTQINEHTSTVQTSSQAWK